MKSFRLIRQLVFRQMKLAPGRAIITMVGIIASTCAVIWIVSGYDALVSQFDENAEKYLGRYDALVLPSGPPGAIQTINEELVSSLQADPGVLELNPITQSRVSVTKFRTEEEPKDESPLGLLIGSRPPVNGAPPLDPILVSTPAAEEPYELVQGEWLSRSDSSTAAVISEGAARQVGVSVGDEILITSLANQVRLTITGIVEQAPEQPSLRGGGPPGGRGRGAGSGQNRGRPGAGPPVGSSESSVSSDTKKPGQQPPESSSSDASSTSTKKPPRLGLPTAFVQGPATNAVYVRPEVAERINGFPSDANVLQISLRDGVTLTEFQKVWQKSFTQTSPPVRLVGYDDVRSGMESTRSLSSQRSQAWAATGMAAVAAVFIIFSTLSMGVSERTREFAMLRAIALTKGQLAGVIALESSSLALLGWIGGLIAGWAMLSIGNLFMPGFFSPGAALGTMSILLTGLTVLVGALGAAILPAWRAIGIKPLEAMSSSQVVKPQLRSWFIMGAVGFAMAASAPNIVFFAPLPDVWRSWLYSTITWPVLLIGMILLTPTVIILAERLLAPLLTKVVGLDSRLVRTQLSSNMWRTIGATLAISLGLALYASTQTWGYSMLQPFLPGPWLPDMLVAFHPVGLDDQGVESVSKVNGVKSDGVLPLTIEQAKFDWKEDGGPSRVRYDNAVLFGLDPQQAFEGENHFLDFQFTQGDRTSVAQELSSGGACLISEDFQISSGIQVGERLTFIPPNAPEERVIYRVAGVVSLPGWHWITKFSGVRRHFVRTAAMLFVSREDAIQDFHLARTEFFWLNLDPDVPLESIEADLQRIAERDAGEVFESDTGGEVKAYRPFARATATETVRKAITLRAREMIWGMSQLPLVTLLIMSLAVVNAMIASVRSRTWEFGVLRSIGITRWQLIRLILVETLLIGIVACMLSLAFGLIAGWCGVGMARYGGWFAGPAPLLIPWSQLSFGFSITLLLCFIAGLWPAMKAGRAEPLKLLQTGRGAL